MALRPSDAYPGQTVADPNYPLGKARNVAVEGDNTGTPLEQKWVNDLWGFLQALLDEAGIEASGDPDEVGASDYLDAVQFLINASTEAVSAALDEEIATRSEETEFLRDKLSPLYEGGNFQPETTLRFLDAESGQATQIQNLHVDEEMHVEGAAEFDDDVEIHGALEVDGDLDNAVTTPLREGGTLNPSALLKLGTNIAAAIFQTVATSSTNATISAFRRIVVHTTTSSDLVDTLDEDGAVAGDWLILVHLNSGGSHEISVKTETGPTEIAVLDDTNGNTGFFYFDATASRWRLGGLMQTNYAT